MEGTVLINARVGIIGLLALACMQLPFRAAWAVSSISSDSFEAQDAQMSPDGIVTATQGVTLRIVSLVDDEIITVTADEANYNTNDGSAELSGEVVLEVQNNGLRVKCSKFNYDPLMERIEVKGLELKVPLYSIVEKSRFPNNRSVSIHRKHFYNFQPEEMYVAAGNAKIEMSAAVSSFILTDVRITHHSDPDPDFFFHAQEVRIFDDGSVELTDIEMNVSGYEIFSWPHLSRKSGSSTKVLSFQFPQFRIQKEDGLSWKQGMKLDLGSFKTDGLFHLAGEHGLLLRGFSYFEPVPGATVGIAYGSSSLVDLNRDMLELNENYNLIYRHHFKDLPGLANQVQLDFEYGDMSETVWEQPSFGLTESTVTETRTLASGEVEFDYIEIAPELFLAIGGMFKLIDYENSGSSYNVVGGNIGVVLKDDSFDHFILYKAHDIKGEDLSNDGSADEAMFSFDEVRSHELDFMTNFRLHPEWSHVVRGLYDIDAEEFDMLQFGTMKRQKTFEVGIYWDFARENAGLEFGFLFD